MEAVYGYYSDVLGRDSIDGLGAPILVSLVGSNYANASWYLQGTYGSFRFGSDFEAALDVVAHEYTHAVITHVIGQGANLWPRRRHGVAGAERGVR